MLSGALVLGCVGEARAAVGAQPNGDDDVAGWADILREGSGQTVAFHAWGGDERINAFIAWAGAQARVLYGVQLRHVKLRDAAEPVALVAAERAAGNTRNGSADLVCVEGRNLSAMRQSGLLDGPVLNLLPGARRVARRDKPSTVMDRMVPLDGYAVPWRLAQLVFIHETRDGDEPPGSIPAMLEWALRHPGRLSHAGVRDANGLAFLEQALHELVSDKDLLRHPVAPPDFARASAPLWDWYDRLRPALWQGGKVFPSSQVQQRSLMKAGEIGLMASLDPSDAVVSIAAGTLPRSARAYVLDGGTVGHCSFVAVPFNAAHRAGALLVANFLLSPQAQARLTDPRYVGVPTVLAMDRLSPADYAYFDAVPRVPDLLSDAERGLPLLEPHVSWVDQIIEGWEKRCAA